MTHSLHIMLAISAFVVVMVVCSVFERYVLLIRSNWRVALILIMLTVFCAIPSFLEYVVSKHTNTDINLERIAPSLLATLLTFVLQDVRVAFLAMVFTLVYYG